MAQISSSFPSYPNLSLLQEQAAKPTLFELMKDQQVDVKTLRERAKNLKEPYQTYFSGKGIKKIESLDKKIAGFFQIRSKLQTELERIGANPSTQNTSWSSTTSADANKDQETRKKIIEKIQEVSKEWGQAWLFRFDIQEIIMQNTDPDTSIRVPLRALNAFVRDLWYAFKPTQYKPMLHDIPPLAKWGRGTSATNGPYTRAYDQDPDYIQILSIPGRFGEKGIIGWTSIAHEVGHDLLNGKGRLIDVIEKHLQQSLPDSNPVLKTYFVNRASEVAADILGVLLLGPAAGIGLVGLLRAYRQTLLSCTDLSHQGTHPVDISRAYLVAYTVNTLFPPVAFQDGFEEGAPVQTWNKLCAETMKEILEDLAGSNGVIQIPSGQGTITIEPGLLASYVENLVGTLIEFFKNYDAEQWRWNLKDNSIVDALNAGKAVSEYDSRHIVAAAFFDALKQEIIEHPTEELFYTPNLVFNPMDVQQTNSTRIINVFKKMIAQLVKQ